MNVLFLCSMNKWRSPTAEKIYYRHPSLQVRSAGTSKKAKRVLSINDLHWAELIIVMENKHKQKILTTFQQVTFPEIIVLDIPDNYQYMDPELIQILRDSIDPIINH